jgi:transposase
MRKMNRPVQKVNGHVAGFDVHKSTITFCVLDRKGNEVAEGQFPADAVSLERFVNRHVGRKRFHFAFEASGYSLWVYDFLVTRCGDEQVHVAHARHVRAIANSPRKNDRNDAFWLAYLTHEGRLPEAQLPAGDLRELRVATRARIRTVRRRTTVITRIRSLLAQVGIRISHKLDSVRGRSRLAEIAATLPGMRGAAVRDHADELDALDRRIRAWEKRIEGLVARFPEVQALKRELPGFGRTLAPAIYAETGSLRRFASAKQLGGYTGLTPTDRSSSGKTHHGRMARDGSRFLRWALIQAVMACLKSRTGPGLAVGDWVRRHQARMGDKKRAQCAAARKLAECAWRLFHYGERFDAARAFSS